VCDRWRRHSGSGYRLVRYGVWQSARKGGLEFCGQVGIIQSDLYRNALHDRRKLPGSIVRRRKRKLRSAAGAMSKPCRVTGLAGYVDGISRGGVAKFHVGQLVSRLVRMPPLMVLRMRSPAIGRYHVDQDETWRSPLCLLPAEKIWFSPGSPKPVRPPCWARGLPEVAFPGEWGLANGYSEALGFG